MNQNINRTHSGAVHGHVDLGAAGVDLDVKDLTAAGLPARGLHVGNDILYREKKTPSGLEEEEVVEEKVKEKG